MVGKGKSEGGNKTFNLVNLSLWLVGPANGVHPGPNCRVGQGDESTTAEQPVSPPPNSPLLLLGGVPTPPNSSLLLLGGVPTPPNSSVLGGVPRGPSPRRLLFKMEN